MSEHALLEQLRRGNETAFAELVKSNHGSMVRVARTYVPTDALAEEVVQEAWLGVVTNLDRFEARSSLKTWLFRIVINRAKTRGVRERRTVTFSALGEDGLDEPTDTAGELLPDEQVIASELRQQIRACVDLLPPQQRTVITLRDIEGWTAAEVCAALGLSDANQRVLLHRARCKVRAALAHYVQER